MYQKRIRGSRECNGRMERARAGRGRRRLAGHAPAYTPELPGLRRRIVVEDFDLGEPARHVLRLYRSGRIDCYEVEVGGRRLPGRRGWARVLELVRKAFVRARAP